MGNMGPQGAWKLRSREQKIEEKSRNLSPNRAILSRTEPYRAGPVWFIFSFAHPASHFFKAMSSFATKGKAANPAGCFVQVLDQPGKEPRIVRCAWSDTKPGVPWSKNQRPLCQVKRPCAMEENISSCKTSWTLTARSNALDINLYSFAKEMFMSRLEQMRSHLLRRSQEEVENQNTFTRVAPCIGLGILSGFTCPLDPSDIPQCA